jgi:hypothetical protein
LLGSYQGSHLFSKVADLRFGPADTIEEWTSGLNALPEYLDCGFVAIFSNLSIDKKVQMLSGFVVHVNDHQLGHILSSHRYGSTQTVKEAGRFVDHLLESGL